jgi:hypothetical protein
LRTFTQSKKNRRKPVFSFYLRLSITLLEVIFRHWRGERQTEDGEEAEEFHFESFAELVVPGLARILRV